MKNNISFPSNSNDNLSFYGTVEIDKNFAKVMNIVKIMKLLKELREDIGYNYKMYNIIRDLDKFNDLLNFTMRIFNKDYGEKYNVDFDIIKSISVRINGNKFATTTRLQNNNSELGDT